MRVLLGVGLLLLAACDAREAPQPQGSEAQAEAGGESVACALDGAKSFATRCAVERAELDGTLFLVVRHPDGGFRRFEVLTDGHGLAVADGADDAKLTIDGEFLEAEVVGDRYRFPATIGGSGGDK